MKSVVQILNAPVYAEDGDLVGKIDDVIVDEDSGNIEYISVQPHNDGRSMRVRLTWQEIVGNGESAPYQLNIPDNVARRMLIGS